MRVNRVGCLVVNSRDQLRSTGSQGVGLVIKDTMDYAAVGHLLGVRVDRVGIERERPTSRFTGTAQDI